MGPQIAFIENISFLLFGKTLLYIQRVKLHSLDGFPVKKQAPSMSLSDDLKERNSGTVVDIVIQIAIHFRTVEVSLLVITDSNYCVGKVCLNRETISVPSSCKNSLKAQP